MSSKKKRKSRPVTVKITAPIGPAHNLRPAGVHGQGKTPVKIKLHEAAIQRETDEVLLEY